MSLTVTAVTAGSAHRALADAVAGVKDGHPLRPVTVIVPTNATGVIARRQLGRLGGVAAVDFVTLYRLAERLAGPALRAQSRLPVSTAVVDVAVRGVLDATSTAFDEVRQHPSTVVAFRDLHRQLRIAGSDAAQRLAAASRRGSDVAFVSRRVSERLANTWYDEGDLLVDAIARVATGGAGDQPAPLVLFLPQTLGPLEVSLVSALAENTAVSVLLGLSGEATADRDLHTLATQLGSPVRSVTSPHPSEIERISVTDADEEVRCAVRVIVDAARAGTPLASMALLWPADRPYARLVEHHLDAAGIAWNGRPGTAVSERVVPRFLLDLLDVDRRGLRRRDVFNLLADIPVRLASGQRAPVVAWERVSREAGVVRDEHWTPRLRAHAAWQRKRAGIGDEPSASVPSADAAESLAEFVAELRHQLGYPSATRAWSEWADWSVEQIEQRVGEAIRQHPDEAELQAWDHTILVLDRLRHLDRVGGPATRSQFRAVFASEFDVAPGRLGRIGNGVTVGSLAGAVGLVTELAIVVGAAEGLLPSPPSINPLISDSDRTAAGLASSESIADRTHRQLLGVIESTARVVVISPRGDLRTTTARFPSRWLLDIPVATETSIASHAAAVLRTPFPATSTEHRLRRRSAQVLLTGPTELGRLAASEGDAVLARGLALRDARRLDTLTIYDGDLSGARVPSFERPVSPTQLQAWGACPHGYFVQYLLGVRAIEEPGDELAITAMDRGNVLHDVLDGFHREVIAGHLPQPTTDGWTGAHIRRLIELLAITTDRFEKSGRTGRAAYWAIDQQRIAGDLVKWAINDSNYAIARRAVVVASEHRFGVDGDVTLALPDGRRLAVYGSVDRIDATATGLVVTDHKTGSTRRFTSIAADDPTAGRTHFQLPAYAAAAVAGNEFSGTVRAEYSFFSTGKYERIGYEFGPSVWTQVADDVALVVSGIEGGWFPAAATKPKYQFYPPCIYCEPDALGTAERFPEWDRKRHDPRLAAWFADTDPDGDDE